MERASGGELGTRREDARDEEGNRAIALRAAAGGQQAIEAELLERAEHRRDMAMGPRACDVEQLVDGQDGLPAQGAAE